jgi:hypothetical protein
MNATLTPSHAEPGTDTPGTLALRELPEAVVRMSRLAERGAGVSQILEQAPVPGATPQHRLMVALMLRGMLWGALRTGRASAGIKNTRRDLERTLRYTDKRITPLAEAANPGSARNIALPAIQPMAIDEYGVEIDVREGPQVLRVLTHDRRERHDVVAVIMHILSDGLPLMSITVNLPARWQPTEPVLRTLCYSIRATYLANWQPGCELLA